MINQGSYSRFVLWIMWDTVRARGTINQASNIQYVGVYKEYIMPLRFVNGVDSRMLSFFLP